MLVRDVVHTHDRRAGLLVRPVARTWEIRQGAGRVELILGRRPLPGRVTEEIDAAGAHGAHWTPDAQALREIAEEKDGAPGGDAPDYRGIETKLVGADAYPPELREDEVTKGSELAISVVENFSGTQGVIRSYTIYGVRVREATTLAGGFVNTLLAAAPTPLPITLKGDFTAYRLGDSRPHSWLERLFSGCQRG